MPQITPCGTAYDLEGPPAAPVVALIHGLGMHRETWSDYRPQLSQRYRVLSYDLGGHGESAIPNETPTLTTIAEQLKRLLDHLDIEKCAIVGFSIGGMINRRFAMDYPERTQSLVILNSPHERTPEAQKLVEERAADTGAGGPGANLDVTLARWFTKEFRKNNPEYIEQISQWVMANDPENYANFRKVLASGVIELIRPHPPVAAPSLVVTCEHDSGSTPEMSHGIASEIAGAEVLIIPSLQHMGLVEQPDLFLKPIEAFLRKTLD